MRKLSEYKDEEALDLLAELLEPAINIMGDGKIAQMLRANEKSKAVKVAIKEHKEDVITIMAILEGKERKDFHCNLLTLPLQLLTILNDPVLVDFFSSQAELISEMGSGSAMANTEAEADTSSNT